MVTKRKLLELLPVRDRQHTIVEDQSTGDIQDGILSRHEKFKKDYDLISDYFITGSVEETAELLWEFLRQNVPYKKESRDLQTVRSPAAILSYPADCKSYALFSAGIIDSLNRKGYMDASYAFRFACYDQSKEPGHVFLVIYPAEDEIWIDPVPEISYFDEPLQPICYQDEIIEPMSLVEISGISRTVPAVSGINAVQVLSNFRDKLNLERLQRLNDGMYLGGPEDQEYIEMIGLVNKQINNGGIGAMEIGVVSDIIDTAKDILSIFKKKDNKNMTPEDYAMSWNPAELELGNQIGYGVAGIIMGFRPDEPTVTPAAVYAWLRMNGAGALMSVTQWPRRVTKQDILSWFERKGWPLTADAQREIGLASGSTALTNLIPSLDGSKSGGSNLLLPLIIGGGVLFLVMRKKKGRR